VLVCEEATLAGVVEITPVSELIWAVMVALR